MVRSFGRFYGPYAEWQVTFNRFETDGKHLYSFIAHIVTLQLGLRSTSKQLAIY